MMNCDRLLSDHFPPLPSCPIAALRKLTARICYDMWSTLTRFGIGTGLPVQPGTARNLLSKMGRKRHDVKFCWSRNSFAIVTDRERLVSRRDNLPDATFHWLTIIKQFRFTSLMGILRSILRLWMGNCVCRVGGEKAKGKGSENGELIELGTGTNNAPRAEAAGGVGIAIGVRIRFGIRCSAFGLGLGLGFGLGVHIAST